MHAVQFYARHPIIIEATQANGYAQVLQNALNSHQSAISSASSLAPAKVSSCIGGKYALDLRATIAMLFREALCLTRFCPHLSLPFFLLIIQKNVASKRLLSCFQRLILIWIRLCRAFAECAKQFAFSTLACD